MTPRLDMNKSARALRAEHKGAVPAGAGYFEAMQLLADMGTRLRVWRRASDGSRLDRRWLVPLAPRTLKRLEAISELMGSVDTHKSSVRT